MFEHLWCNSSTVLVNIITTFDMLMEIITLLVECNVIQMINTSTNDVIADPLQLIINTLLVELITLLVLAITLRL